MNSSILKLHTVSGYSGYSGESNISGYSGYSGSSGYSGLDGGAAASGFSGYSGYSGESNISGYSGYSGATGAGTSGYSGYSGISGFSGRSGYSGAQGLQGCASLILNGGGDCTTDWLLDGEYNISYWDFTGMAYGTVLTGSTSGFTGNALKIVVDADFSLPCGTYETSFYLQTGVEYTLTFDYRSNVPLSITDGIITYQTFAASPSAVTGATLTFTAQNDYPVFFGAATGDTVTNDDWWIIDNVNLKCASCCDDTTININNNADNRILTANGTDTSIDAESGFTYDNTTGIATLQQDLKPPVFLLEAFSTGNTNFGMGSSTGLATTSGPTLAILRSRGTNNAMKPPQNGDTLYEQIVYASYGSGTTVDKTTEILKMSLVAEETYNSPTSTCKSSFTIATRNYRADADVVNDRIMIESEGDVRILNGIKADQDVNFRGVIFFTGNTDMGDAFTYIGEIGAGRVDITLPAVTGCTGRVYYVVLKSTSGGDIRLLTKNPSTEKIGYKIAAPAFALLDTPNDFIMLQSDGLNRWTVLSINGVTV